MQFRFAGLVAALTLTSISLAQSDTPTVGFAQVDSRTLPFASDACGFVGASALAIEATLDDGRIVRFTGEDVQMLASDGSLLSTLGSLAGPVFPSFISVDPTESFAVVGESCNGEIFRVDLAAGGFTPLTSIPFNYDAVFATDPNFVFVSASGTATFGRNRIYLVNVNDGTTTLRGRVAGFSGPLAMASDGTLFYATQRSGHDKSVITWSAFLAQSGVLLTEGNSNLFVTGLSSASGLNIDPVTGNLLVTEFQALRLFDSSGTELGTVASAGAGSFLGNVEIRDAGGSGSLQAFQPANCSVRYTVTDFFSFGERRTTVPVRAVATLTGPTSGAAAKTLTITGAHPNTRVLVFYNTTAFLNPAEFVFGSFGFPYHSALPLDRSRPIRPAVVADSQGTAVFTYNDPGSLHGSLVFQALIRGANGQTVGTSSYVLN
ncbi:MAG: hypothetical protein ACI8QZ_002933 [Chlamydiales bacterium]|jgi:hypothetical protein